MGLVKILAPFFLFVAGFGLQQSFDWDALTLIVAMIIMVPCACLLADRFLHPATRARFENEANFQLGFLIAVSGFALMVSLNGAAGFTGAKHPIVRYAAIWWFCFPYACGVLVFLDRMCGAFGTKPQLFKRDETEDHFPGRSPAIKNLRKRQASEATEEDNVIQFDPDRFR